MRGVLSKFTKNIDIEVYFSCLPAFTQTKTTESLIKYFNQNKFYYVTTPVTPYYEKDVVKKILLSDHAYKRWNQRVSYTASSKNILESKINFLYHQLNRVVFDTQETGLIDNDILFIYEVVNDVAVISTFYGRLSQNPSLQQFKAMRQYNNQKDEFIELSLNPDALEMLFDPPLPNQRIVFKGSTSRYQIDTYQGEESTLFILSILEGQGKGTCRQITTNNPNCDKFEKSVRQALILLGHEEFVYNHVLFHYPKELQRQIERFIAKKKNHSN